MAGRDFNRWWLLTVLGLCLLQVIVAVVADPYCVYGIIRFPKRNFEPNSRFLKVEYLQRHPEYDAFILGSSRAGFLESSVADRVCGDRTRFFNLNGSLESGAGIRRKLQWLASSRRVRRAVVLVDFDLQSVGTDPFDLLRQDHPLVARSAFTAFYAKYLLFQPRILYLYGEANLREPKGEPWNAGNPSVPDPLYRTRPLFDRGRLYDVTWGAVTQDLASVGEPPDLPAASGIEEFRRTIAILDGAGIDRVLIVPPYRLDQFAGFHPDALALWLRDVVDAGGAVWDFAGYNPVTADPSRYVDAIHFDDSVGERILRRACGVDDDPNDAFGVRVTAANLEAHIASLRLQHTEALKAAGMIEW